MKRREKLRYGVLWYFLLFAAIILSAIWIFQILFTEGYYQNAKIENMKSLGRDLKNAESSDDFIKAVRKSAELGIFVYMTGEDGNVGYPTDYGLTEEEISAISDAARSLGQSGKDEYLSVAEADGRETFSFIYATKTEGGYIILTSSREKILETLFIVRMQLLSVTFFVSVIGVVLAWYLSSKIAKPLAETSETAKKWADGNNSVVFPTDGKYFEINELCAALNFAKESVQKSETLSKDLIANVSHDLKTPLTMIKAYAEMIKDLSGDIKEKREKHTQVIIDEADRLTMLVNDILDLSKLQSDVDALDLSEVNLSRLTERVIDRFTPFVEKQGFKIENHVAPDLLTSVDEEKIERVLYNLVGNSINYTGEDKTVKVFLTAEGDKILLEIIDSGKGISKENIDTIWNRYYRFSETNTRPVKGTGLGLSIVKAILDSHGLRYGVRSKKDFGSNFYVEFERERNE